LSCKLCFCIEKLVVDYQTVFSISRKIAEEKPKESKWEKGQVLVLDALGLMLSTVHHAAMPLQCCESWVREDCQIQGSFFNMHGNIVRAGKLWTFSACQSCRIFSVRITISAKWHEARKVFNFELDSFSEIFIQISLISIEASAIL